MWRLFGEVGEKVSWRLRLRAWEGGYWLEGHWLLLPPSLFFFFFCFLFFEGWCHLGSRGGGRSYHGIVRGKKARAVVGCTWKHMGGAQLEMHEHAGEDLDYKGHMGEREEIDRITADLL